jgi:hypothetical protein
MVEIFFLILSFLTAGASSQLWFNSARVETPPHIPSSYAGREPFANAIAKQAKWNTRAALAASLAAFFQALAIGSKLFGFLS